MGDERSSARRLAEEFAGVFTPGDRQSLADTIEEAFEWLNSRSIASRLEADEVTDAMLKAAYNATGCPVGEQGPGPRNREFFAQIYLAMRRAAQE